MITPNQRDDQVVQALDYASARMRGCCRALKECCDEASMTDSALFDPLQWSATFSGPPAFSSEPARWKGARVSRWTDTAASMLQPPLNHHVLVLHLGGDKRVQRGGDGLRRVYDVPIGGLTIIPAGVGFDWLTEGPVDFAHIYIPPDRLDQTLAFVFDRDPSGFVLHAPVGVEDLLVRELVLAVLEEVAAPSAPRAYLDSLFEAILARIVQRHSNVGEIQDMARHTLAPTRLKRVLDHIEIALSGALDLQVLADIAGLSRFHFSRAFQQAVGEPPLAYVARRRVETAKGLLRASVMPLADVAARAGFNSASYFSTAFRRAVGRSPSEYRYGKV